jgi:hypothetical protein
MNWSWLKDTILELAYKLFHYVFSGAKQSDAAGPGEFEDKLKDKIKKDGW